MSTFPDFLRSLGLSGIPPIVPGKWQRCATEDHPRRRNGSFKLCDDGRAGFGQNFATMTECAIWRSGDAAAETRDAQDMALINARIAARREEQRAGTARALAWYHASTPLLDAAHLYLAVKRMSMAGCLGLRVDAGGALVVPMYRAGQLVSVQRILPDGSKLFASGASTKGAFLRLLRKGSTVSILCEGLATGCTVFAACPDASVTVCFSAANLIEVAKALDWSGLCVIAADDDAETFRRIGRNPGLDAAREAARAVNCHVASPAIPTDFNDMFTAELARLEAEPPARPPKTPARLRAEALAPVRAIIMQAVHYVANPLPEVPSPRASAPPCPPQPAAGAYTGWRYQVEHTATGMALSTEGGREVWAADLWDASDYTRSEAAAWLAKYGPRTHRLIPLADLRNTP